ncbi:PREDICTED: leucine-rich repeat and immunoglobulin-like domain-containing nogo receptor-interacting protein 3 [Branchiostoma belcheri]|uniref:Leucine-rich repeat and immunoglobulin-like domain-containing nogo receptor-interacting protein 3 n=1 Tax=Branchiostoma belcheri TaxID=7741 RepID=A0A6P4Y4I1_BRABE|nr:PREDICTED: leucine-rich repeat and immunoglobulin-like domain-containing nogo receptor-interacting protein 3 [Branchiostoma belcheri]
MAVSGLIIVMLGSLWTGCSCLSAECRVQKEKYSDTLWVYCSHLNLTTIPDDMPSNAGRFSAQYNSIRNVTCLPSLPRLQLLDLGMNSMESFSWMSLRNLPNLRFLYLTENRLRYVQFVGVIEHLPKLQTVDLSNNKLTSLSEYELGWPQVKEARIGWNPFHCDCDLLWLIDKLTCLQSCGEGDQTCCSSCAACFLVYSLRIGRFHCQSPSRLKRVPLSKASAQLQECREQTTPSTTNCLWIFHDVSVASNWTIKANQLVGLAQTMPTTILHITANNDTKCRPTECNITMAANPTEGSGHVKTS